MELNKWRQDITEEAALLWVTYTKEQVKLQNKTEKRQLQEEEF